QTREVPLERLQRVLDAEEVVTNVPRLVLALRHVGGERVALALEDLDARGLAHVALELHLRVRKQTLRRSRVARHEDELEIGGAVLAPLEEVLAAVDRLPVL